MDFTIEVEKVEIEKRYEEVTLKDLKMYHKECYGGEIVAEEILGGRIFRDSEPSDYLVVNCKRCHRRVWVWLDNSPHEPILKTMFDGKKRRIYKSASIGKIFPNYSTKLLYNESWVKSDHYSDLNFKKYHVDFYVVQKDSEKFYPEPSLGEFPFEEIYCSYCGEELLPIFFFCPFCGANIKERIEETKKATTEK